MRGIIITVLLSLLACLGNVLAVSLAYGVDLIFGTIFVLVAVSYLGPRQAMIVALSGGLYTWAMWGHGYASMVFVGEAAVVFWLHRRLNKSLLLSDGLFWGCLGAPITLLYLNQMIGLSLESSSLIALKQFINAIFNVLLASLAVLLINTLRGQFSAFYLGRKQIKDILFHSMVALTLGAGTLPIIQSGKNDEASTKEHLEATLSGPLNHLTADLELSQRPAAEVLEVFAARPRIDQSLSFAVVDQNGQVMASARNPWTASSESVPNALQPGTLVFLPPDGNMSFVQRLRQGRYQMAQSINDGQERWVLIQTPAAPFAEAMADATFKLLALLGVLLLLAIVASQILSRLLTAPMWRLSAALNSSNNGIVITNLAGEVEWINYGFTKISGYSLADMKGKKPGVVLQGAGTDPKTIAVIREALVENRKFDVQLINYDRNGSPYWVQINGEPMLGENGRREGYIAVETDVTEQRKMKEVELFGREALEKIAKNEPLEDIYTAILAGMESIIPVRCVIELTGYDTDTTAYLPRACFINTQRGSVVSFGEHDLQTRPIQDSSGHHLGTLRILSEPQRYRADWEIELGDRASQLIGIATERFWSDRRLQETASVFRCVDEGIFITNADFVIADVNAAFLTITGYQGREVTGQKADSILAHQGQSILTTSVLSALDQYGQWQGETRFVHNKGNLVHLGLSISAILDKRSQVTGYIFLISDITELKDYQRQLESMAHFDALTGLPNRVLLGDRLDQAMRKADRHQKRLAVLFIDLDGFKKVNDTLGHEGGDELLKMVTRRISSELRDTDTFARFGGDEFIVVLPELSQNEAVDDVVRRILLAVGRQTELAGRPVEVTASIGVTFYPQKEALDADQLLRQADQAMYAAKQRGRNGFQYFDTDNDEAVRQLHVVVAELRSALEKDEFVLFYQPKVNLQTGDIVGAEALIRWNHPAKGLTPPGEFLPIIENHILSVDIGEWVLHKALTQMAAWQKLGCCIPVSVNINSLHFRQHNFARRLDEILQQHPSVSPEHLELEIVETSALENLETVSGLLRECQALGVVFSLDDFGTGFSSLSYLRRLPVQKLKVDMSFVRDMLVDANDFAIVQGILSLARSFELEVIAEGVETQEHSARLIEIGCFFGQGYGIAKPMPGDRVAAWAEQWNATQAHKSEHAAGADHPK
ncbi:MAG: EAL domain-containing protein [Pseudomonadota bacterium]|nr:EAL domain-containing protein [Pseudomonadota bacterium]